LCNTWDFIFRMEKTFELLAQDRQSKARHGHLATAHGGIETPKGLLRPRPAAQHRRFARDDAATHALRRRHQRRGDIARADILRERRLDLGRKIPGQVGH